MDSVEYVGSVLCVRVCVCVQKYIPPPFTPDLLLLLFCIKLVTHELRVLILSNVLICACRGRVHMRIGFVCWNLDSCSFVCVQCHPSASRGRCLLVCKHDTLADDDDDEGRGTRHSGTLLHSAATSWRVYLYLSVEDDADEIRLRLSGRGRAIWSLEPFHSPRVTVSVYTPSPRR